MTSGKTEKEDETNLDWRDYVAFVIALFQTVLLPVVVIIAVLVVILVLLR